MKDNFIVTAVTIALIVLICGGIIGVGMGAEKLGINLGVIFTICCLGMFLARVIQWVEGGDKGADVLWWGGLLAVCITSLLLKQLKQIGYKEQVGFVESAAVIIFVIVYSYLYPNNPQTTQRPKMPATHVKFWIIFFMGMVGTTMLISAISAIFKWLF